MQSNDIITISTRTAKKGMREILLICAATAIAAITVCSRSSFIYPLNDWVDPNCFFTVGKAMAHGVVPYRDLLEQKGPFLYFLHAIASLVSFRTFLGVYFIEIIAAAFFLWFSHKTLALSCGDNAMYELPLLAVLVYTSKAFCSGDSAEELCLPFLAHALYIALRTAKNKTPPSGKDCLFIGIGAACVFWTKFSMVGIYVGIFIAFFIDMLRSRMPRAIGKSVVFAALGLVIGTLPWIVYFGLNAAIKDWLEVYLYDNVFVYAKSGVGHPLGSMFNSLRTGIIKLWRLYPAAVLAAAAGLVYGIYRRAFRSILYAAAAFAGAFVVQFIGGRSYDYYSFVMSPFIAVGLVPVCFIASAVSKNLGRAAKVLAAVYMLACSAGFLLTDNRNAIGIDKDELPQYYFAQIIAETPNATLLNYGFLDGGYYTTTGIIPRCRAFCKLNISLDEMLRLQDDYIETAQCDYIVSMDAPPDPAIAAQYEVIAFKSYPPHTYFLLQRLPADP